MHLNCVCDDDTRHTHIDAHTSASALTPMEPWMCYDLYQFDDFIKVIAWKSKSILKCVAITVNRLLAFIGAFSFSLPASPTQTLSLYFSLLLFDLLSSAYTYKSINIKRR